MTPAEKVMLAAYHAERPHAASDGAAARRAAARTASTPRRILNLAQRAAARA